MIKLEHVAVITNALDYLVSMPTHYSTLDCCHPLLLMTMIHPQMHHQVMLPHHDQDLLSLVPMTTHYSTLDRCHPLMMRRRMRVIQCQMHHQVMLTHHD
jgi:hypothetical protein